MALGSDLLNVGQRSGIVIPSFPQCKSWLEAFDSFLPCSRTFSALAVKGDSSRWWSM